MSSISVKELDDLIKAMFDLREEIESLEEIIKEKNKQLVELQNKSVAALKEHGRSSYKTDFGTVGIVERWRVSLPQGPEEKKALFHKLEEMGIFWDYATVNSNSLNSLYMKEWEAAKERGQGMEFSFPGVGEPKLYETVSMRKK